MINAAVFETENYRYAITYEWGEDGSGLTEEELVERPASEIGVKNFGSSLFKDSR